ncbi:Ankyrin repeat-containing protein [Alkalispirochaeta americana]|uniref:Ankyrin repeat-containing protein n=1 Tax=Alkalispirochaeta americana TaxID=159291 RepID=A0A1N6XU21_9SPIO|nr:ankyrin repeat domain-containing protein [Alkalispirochaeta americana]SIR05671.1 Ankyrin repeat-containing protein [Alkalispirochaeta americana]
MGYQVPLKPGVRCDECGNLLFGWYTRHGNRLFCSYGCQERYQRREDEYEQRQFEQEQQQQAQAEARSAEERAKNVQRIAAIRHDPRYNEIKMIGALVGRTDEELLADYMSRYGDPLQNPSLLQSAQPFPSQTHVPTGEPKTSFFDDSSAPPAQAQVQTGESKKSFFDDDPDPAEERQIKIFTKLAVASMVDDMKAMLLDGAVDSEVLCHNAMQHFLTLPDPSIVSHQVADLILAFGNLQAPQQTSVWPEIVSFGMTDIVQKALDRGAEINVGNDGKTPLNLAIRQRDVNMVKLLLERGADPNYFQTGFFVDAEYAVPPLVIAEQVGDEEIIALLQEHGASTDT